ncbi:uncharacterized protein K444DRAFT_627724 [Hyaloscypha bicolor E]|uniref:Uncharacterized protein n=1 Tax=Hyaloscypha bicolor E TaxID=1095630 RepID=A0A2J6TIL2_9HELO|nr:uncharacterized protein K444DRAFT_627724 [Hyaloscypha bicolor E]PMD62856.1 hypothetical protein K444DRAFT_627724 [Hyaloscypha bicolor E]
MAAGVLVSLSPWLTAERAAGGTSVSSLSPAVSCLEESDKGQETQKPPGQDHSSGSHRWTVTGGTRVPGLVSPLSWGHWFWMSSPLESGHAVSPPPMLLLLCGEKGMAWAGQPQ